MKLDDFDYHLPEELIAQEPAPERSASRMLVVNRSSGTFEDHGFRELPRILRPGDVLAVNNSRVMPARLFGRRAGVRSQPLGKRNPARGEYLSSEIEILLTRPVDQTTWEALVKPGRKVREGERILLDDRAALGSARDPVEVEVVGQGEFGVRLLRFPAGLSVPEILERLGHVPLPPYIRRTDSEADRARYQTVYARLPGSVAAPTAGLHFTEELLDELKQRDIERAEITLHVGLGTFRPIHTEQIEKHVMHAEHYEIGPQTAGCLNRALAENRRIVAVGTTTVRTLEHVAAIHDGGIAAGSGETRLFILPGFSFRVVGGLLTNFHLPRTTLLMLVAAFGGRDLILAAYEHAVRERYRFYSYGDCMLVL